MPHFSHWRRDFLQKSMASAAVFLGAACSKTQRPEDEPFELAEATVATLRQRLKNGQDSAVSLVEKYLARIELIDRAGPRTNSMIEINPDALAIAQSLDAERRTGQIRGPLLGAFLHGNPGLRAAFEQYDDEMKTYIDPLRSAGSLESTYKVGSGAFRQRIRDYLARLDELQRQQTDSFFNRTDLKPTLRSRSIVA